MYGTYVDILISFSVSASFDGKQHLLSLPVVNSIGYVLRFLKKLCRSLLCDNLFSNQPFPQYNTSENPEEYENGRMESGRFKSLWKIHLREILKNQPHFISYKSISCKMLSVSVCIIKIQTI